MSFKISLYRCRGAAPAVLVVALTLLAQLRAMAKFDAELQGQSANSTIWIANNLQGWRELDFIPVRVYMTGGPATNQHILVEFDHFKVVRPGIENLTDFSRSSNVVMAAGPTLNAPLNSDLWSYAFTVALTDNKPGFVEFRARLAAGSHINTGSSLHLSGDTSLGTLQIHKPGPGAGIPDLVVIKRGPANANAGETITYTLNYSNKMTAAAGATGVQLTDVLPPSVTYVPNSSPGASLVGNILTWDLGSLARGASGSVSFRAAIHGTVTNGQVLENNSAIYSAENDANLSDNSSKLTTIIVLNRAPEAIHDAYTVDEDATLSVSSPGVLSNDRDLDGNPLIAIILSAPSHGVLAFSTNGGFVYKPNTNYNGPDSFTYKVNDGRVDSAAATVNITVNPVNDAPSAANDSLSVNEDATLTVATPGVLANDADIDGGVLRALLVSGPGHGILTLNANGSLLYTPAPNYNGLDSFTYKANDGSADSCVATVAITVRPVNDPPAFTKGPNQLVQQNTGPQTTPNWASNINPGPADEAGQTVTFVVTANSNPSLFSAQPAISPQGTLTFAPATNAYGTVVITVVLRDNGGTENGGTDTSASQTFTITVNAPPVVSIVTPTNGAFYIAPANISVAAEASDPDGLVTNVLILQQTNQLASLRDAPYYTVWTNVPAGQYRFSARATDNTGATGESSLVNVTVLEQPPILIVTPMHLNRQTGLYEHTVRVLNPTTYPYDAVRVLIRNLPADTRVYNASGQTNGIPYVQSNLPVPPGGSVDFRIEYYANRALEPILEAQLISVNPPFNPTGTFQHVSRVLRLSNGTFLIEFNSLLNRTYYVQYAKNLTDWKTVTLTLTGTGTRMQWLDNGPPKTETDPASEPFRIYRLLMLP